MRVATARLLPRAKGTLCAFLSAGDHAMKRLLVVLLACVLVQSAQAQTVKLVTERTADHPALILLKGQMKIPSSALRTFIAVSALQNEQTIVLLNSPGGAIGTAIEIGKIIKQRGFKTAVPDFERCLSACALIWLAGKERLVGGSASIGFHSTRPALTSFETSYRGNAAVEGYLAYALNRPELTAYVNKASPRSMTWLTIADAKELKLEVTQFSLANPQWAWAREALERPQLLKVAR
jgi:membrane-bound ClpP family serine protease